jgi:hypothetical protein
MYLQNKYTAWYYNIINYAKSRTLLADVYTEKHHIIPKSLGGDNSKDNLVKLTAKEHFICHLLLPKMVEINVQKKMIFALWRMSFGKDRYKPCSRLYENIRKLAAANQTGTNHWSKQPGKIHNTKINHPRGMLDKKHTAETKQRMVSAQTDEKNHFKNKKHTDDTKELIRVKRKSKIWITNGEIDLMLDKTLPIPNGFSRGRVNGLRGLYINNIYKLTSFHITGSKQS